MKKGIFYISNDNKKYISIIANRLNISVSEALNLICDKYIINYCNEKLNDNTKLVLDDRTQFELNDNIYSFIKKECSLFNNSLSRELNHMVLTVSEHESIETYKFAGVSRKIVFKITSDSKKKLQNLKNENNTDIAILQNLLNKYDSKIEQPFDKKIIDGKYYKKICNISPQAKEQIIISTIEHNISFINLINNIINNEYKKYNK